MIHQADDPIIIYGAPRSGTTYIQRMLSEHPDIFLTNESRIFLWLHQSVSVIPYNDEFLLEHREEFIAHLHDTLPDVIRSFYRKMAPDARLWGDKYPIYASSHRHAGCLNAIVSLFPDTRFINIIRDGRDVVCSLIRKSHEDGRPWATFEGAHQVWNGHLRGGCSFGRAQSPDRYLELRYEDVVQDDAQAAQQILEFLGIEMHPKVVDFCHAQQEGRTPLSEPTRDLSKGAVQSTWAELLSPEEQLCSLGLIGEQLVEHGYETHASLAALRERIEVMRAAQTGSPGTEC